MRFPTTPAGRIARYGASATAHHDARHEEHRIAAQTHAYLRWLKSAPGRPDRVAVYPAGLVRGSASAARQATIALGYGFDLYPWEPTVTHEEDDQ